MLLAAFTEERERERERANGRQCLASRPNNWQRRYRQAGRRRVGPRQGVCLPALVLGGAKMPPSERAGRVVEIRMSLARLREGYWHDCSLPLRPIVLLFHGQSGPMPRDAAGCLANNAVHPVGKKTRRYAGLHGAHWTEMACTGDGRGRGGKARPRQIGGGPPAVDKRQGSRTCRCCPALFPQHVCVYILSLSLSLSFPFSQLRS